MSNPRLMAAFRDQFAQLGHSFNRCHSLPEAREIAQRLCFSLADFAGSLMGQVEQVPAKQPEPPRYYNPSPSDCDPGQLVYYRLADGKTYVPCDLVEYTTDVNSRDQETTAVLKRRFAEDEVSPFPYVLADWDCVFVIENQATFAD